MDDERMWVVKVSLAVLGASYAFFIAAPPLFGFPLDQNAGEVTRVLQIITPVFIAYLSAGAAYLFAPQIQTGEVNINPERRRLMRLLIRGPVFIACGGLILTSFAFWYSNRHAGPPGTGMSLDQFCWSITALLGIMASSTGLIVAKIFPAEITN
jgi:hypothetical protein